MNEEHPEKENVNSSNVIAHGINDDDDDGNVNGRIGGANIDSTTKDKKKNSDKNNDKNDNENDLSTVKNHKSSRINNGESNNLNENNSNINDASSKPKEMSNNDNTAQQPSPPHDKSDQNSPTSSKSSSPPQASSSSTTTTTPSSPPRTLPQRTPSYADRLRRKMDENRTAREAIQTALERSMNDAERSSSSSVDDNSDQNQPPSQASSSSTTTTTTTPSPPTPRAIFASTRTPSYADRIRRKMDENRNAREEIQTALERSMDNDVERSSCWSVDNDNNHQDTSTSSTSSLRRASSSSTRTSSLRRASSSSSTSSLRRASSSSTTATTRAGSFTLYERRLSRKLGNLESHNEHQHVQQGSGGSGDSNEENRNDVQQEQEEEEEEEREQVGAFQAEGRARGMFPSWGQQLSNALFRNVSSSQSSSSSSNHTTSSSAVEGECDGNSYEVVANAFLVEEEDDEEEEDKESFLLQGSEMVQTVEATTVIQTAIPARVKPWRERHVLQTAVDAFYDRILQDEDIMPFFKDANLEKLKFHNHNFVTYAFSDVPLGMNVHNFFQDTHKPMFDKGLSEAHFDIFIKHFRQTLQDLNMPKEFIDEAVTDSLMPKRVIFVEGAKEAKQRQGKAIIEEETKIKQQRKRRRMVLGASTTVGVVIATIFVVATRKRKLV